MNHNFTLKIYINTTNNESQTTHKNEHLASNVPDVHQAPQHCVDNVLNFARSYRIINSKNIGRTEMMIN